MMPTHYTVIKQTLRSFFFSSADNLRWHLVAMNVEKKIEMNGGSVDSGVAMQIYFSTANARTPH